jgi:hypothetical protein
MVKVERTILVILAALATVLFVYATVRVWTIEEAFSPLPGWHTTVYPRDIAWTLLTSITLLGSILIYLAFRTTIRILTKLWSKPKSKLLPTLIILASTTLTASGQIRKCDVTRLRYTSEKIGKLTAAEITDFLLTFGQECRNNAEYSEWSNELLFKVLDQQTELVLKTIEKEESGIEFAIILDDLSNPIMDGVNLKNLVARIEKIDFNPRLKQEIIKSLNTADAKY